MENEQQLLSAINQGDRAAMRQLYERYKGYAMSIGEGSLKGWIGRIVANKAFDFVKHHERMTFTDVIPDTQDEEPEIERIPPNVLTAMIAKLPTGYRMVLNLYVFEHCSHREIANKLGIKESSSSSQLSRARQILTQMITDYIKRHEI